MIYVLIAIVLVAALLLVRVRFRLEIAPEKRLLFVGLGRSGPEFDFVRREAVIRLSGLKIKRIQLGAKTGNYPEDTAPSTPVSKKKPSSAKRAFSISSLFKILPQCLHAFGRYAIGLLKAAIVEEARGEIEAGFETPDITGQVFGYYQAALASAPGLMGRIRYNPVWTGPSFSGSACVVVAWPVYRLVWQTALLMFRLPLIKIINLAIGKKEGVRDVQ